MLATLRAARVGRMPRFGRNLWIFLASTTIIFAGVAVQQLVYNLYLVQVGYREDFIGIYTLVNIGAVGLISIPISGLSNRFGMRACMVAGVGMLIAGSVG